MKFIADFHIHSHYSIATSKNLNPEHLDYWARLKGISVIGTGDFTHPGWLAELKEKLEPAGDGLFKLKESYRSDPALQLPFAADRPVRFMLTAEISSIYKKSGKVRKVHNVIFVPDFDTAEKIQAELAKIGNITSDGRPILGIDSRDLLEIALNANDDIFFLPAHIWTPWFSALGSKSGFDTIEECYGDLADHIHAVETGLSTDPPLNWMCSFLDKYTLLSNSDAHSPEKLGRNANMFNTGFSYTEMIRAIKTSDPQQFLGTIDLFPQEGKYHYDGHRKCGICWDPVQTQKHKSLCPVCGKKVTLGVTNRLVSLSDREDLTERPNRRPYFSIIPLKEILAELNGAGPGSKSVNQAYHSLVQKAGSEFNVLLNLSLADLGQITNELTVEAIRRMRSGEVFIREGFDGQFGRINVFDENEPKKLKTQATLFANTVSEKKVEYRSRKLLSFDLGEFRQLKNQTNNQEKLIPEMKPLLESDTLLDSLNPDQRSAADFYRGPQLIIAGPGTGKTRVLTYRIAGLIRNKHVAPENILALTYTNKAAAEMQERLADLLKNKKQSGALMVSTFHALGYKILKKHAALADRDENFIIVDEQDKQSILKTITDLDKTQRREVGAEIKRLKQADPLSVPEFSDNYETVFENYQAYLKENNAFDLDDLIYQPLRLLSESAELLSFYRGQYQWVLVDEYQDINSAQYRLIRLLAAGLQANLCVIGDPNQAIYGFRGADAAFINRFLDDYPDAEVFRLKKSYRCSKNILKASSEVIYDGPADKRPELEGIQKGLKIQIAPQASDKSEAEYIARTIEQMIGGLRFFSMDSDISKGEKAGDIESLSDFAVLCRTARQMPALEKAFTDHTIPYQLVRNDSFFDQKPQRLVVLILKALVYPDNSFLRQRLADSVDMPANTFQHLRALALGKPALPELISEILKSIAVKTQPETNLSGRELLNMAAPFGANVSGFLKFAALGSGADNYVRQAEKVTLMTLHASKGLEFKCVFIAGVEKGLLPYDLFESQVCDRDEEKRLFYVGMTRAQKYLYLTHARQRFIFGRTHLAEPSPFLNPIENELIELSKSSYKKRPQKDDGQLKLF